MRISYSDPFRREYDCRGRILKKPLQFGMYTAFMVSKVELSADDAYKTYTENDSGLLMKQLQGEKYSCYKNDPRMERIVEGLKSVAVV